mgnify:CR=1 FL=1
MNIYEMYILNGDVDFWVVRHTWGKCIARIVYVGGLKTPAPYYGNPEVLMDLYSAETGEIIKQDERMSCPGTSQYTWITLEGWTPSEPLRAIPSSPPDPAFRKRMEVAEKRAERDKARKQKIREANEAKPRLYFASNPRFMAEKHARYGKGFYVRWDRDRQLWWCLQEDASTQEALQELGCEFQPS